MREPIRRGSRSPIGNSPLSISSAHTFTANGTTPCCQRARKHSQVILTRRLSAAVGLGIPAPERLGAFSALSHALRRRFCRCGASADALACAQAAHRAVASQPAVPPGAVLYYAQMLSVVYEVAGDLNALATAASLFDILVRESGTGAFEPPVAGLAESYLLHYQRAGNANDLDEAFGLTLPVRYTAMDPPPNSIYVQACALREMYRRTGSIQRLDESII